MNIKKALPLIILSIVLLITFFVGIEVLSVDTLPNTDVKTSGTITPALPVASDYFSYQGEAGKDALTILKEKATVEQDDSGIVVAINGRKAISEKREYWAFYVNGQLAPMGPADYETKEGDRIEWRIENY